MTATRGLPISQPAGTTIADTSSTLRSREAWSALGWLGLAFAVLGVADICLGVFPTAFDKPEWVFGTISAVLNGFAIPMMGVYLFLASGLAKGGRLQLLGTSVAAFLMAGLLLSFGVYFLTVTPLAIDSVRANPETLLGIKKGIAKAILLNVAYVVLLVVGGVRAWMTANRRG